MTQNAAGHHPNRKPYNFAVYEARDRFFAMHRAKFAGEVFDLGCGEAPFRDFVLAAGGSYTGIDWSSSYHQTKADVIADLNERLPVADAVADTVLSVSVLEHLHSPNLMLSEAFRLLKPGGHLVLQVPWMWHVHEQPHDYYRYTPFGLQHLLGKCGFVDIRIVPSNGAFGMLALKTNYLSKRLIKGPPSVRTALSVLMRPLWWANLRIGHRLDALDRNPTAEASSYFVTARRPE